MRLRAHQTPLGVSTHPPNWRCLADLSLHVVLTAAPLSSGWSPNLWPSSDTFSPWRSTPSTSASGQSLGAPNLEHFSGAGPFSTEPARSCFRSSTQNSSSWCTEGPLTQAQKRHIYALTVVFSTTFMPCFYLDVYRGEKSLVHPIWPVLQHFYSVLLHLYLNLSHYVELFLPSTSATEIWNLLPEICQRHGDLINTVCPLLSLMQGTFCFRQLVTILSESRNDPSSPQMKQDRLSGGSRWGSGDCISVSLYGLMGLKTFSVHYTDHL